MARLTLFTAYALMAMSAAGCRLRVEDTPSGGGGAAGTAGIGGTSSGGSAGTGIGGSGGAAGASVSWTPRVSGSVANLYGVWLDTDGTNVLAVGEQGTILQSKDGATTWAAISSGTTRNLKAVWLQGPEAYAVGEAGTILHSSDGGGSFSLEPAGISVDLESVWASGPKEVFVSGAAGTIFRSMDEGATWKSLPNGAMTTVHCVWGAGATEIYAAAESSVLVSGNGGDSWQLATSSLYPQLGIWATNPKDVYTVNTGSVITHFDGAVWHKTIVTPARELTAVWGPSTSEVFVVGELGTVLRTNDQSDTWESEDSGVSTRLNDVHGVPTRSVAVGDTGIVIVREQ